MKPEQQRIAIAEACGLTIVSDGITHHLIPCGKKTDLDPEGCLLKECPNYLNDLNAMNDALITMTDDQWARYVKILSGETAEESLLPTHYWQLDDVLDIVKTTTAAQAEAFLKTIGKWKES